VRRIVLPARRFFDYKGLYPSTAIRFVKQFQKRYTK
jgi:hypothetical protein